MLPLGTQSILLRGRAIEKLIKCKEDRGVDSTLINSEQMETCVQESKTQFIQEQEWLSVEK